LEKYECPICHRTTYTAYYEASQTCPYCSTEKILILNQAVFCSKSDFTDTKIIFDRRNINLSFDFEKRAQGKDELIPVAWLVIKQNASETNVT